MFEPPAFALSIIEKIESAGYEAYLVGGCVRDMLLSRVPSDWDIASSALPQDIMRIFPKTVPTGLKYGTVTVIFDEGKAEVTTFRSESSYSDHRRPDGVNFCSNIEKDLSRRDFTINAMAYSPRRGFIDPFDGRSDIKNRKIRAVGNPGKRFEEDALRILRAFRFAAQLGFEIDRETLKAANDKAFLVAKISYERIRNELNRIFESDNPHIAFEITANGILDFCGIKSNENLPDTAGDCLDMTPPSLSSRWAAFFYLLKTDNVKSVLEKLRFDNLTKHKVLKLLAELELKLPSTPIDIKRRLANGLSPDFYAEYLNLYSAINYVDVSSQLDMLDEIIRRGEPFTQKMLAINGNDLIENGVASGPDCGRILRSLLDIVISNPSLNDKKTLLTLAKRTLS